MKALVQHYKSGKVLLVDVPYPRLRDKFIIVRTLYSAISVGTELSRVSSARNIFVMAKEKKDQVRLVLKSLRDVGLKETYERVMNRLDAYVPLGYSMVGEVVEVGSGVDGIIVGDIVAGAGGEFAYHSEYVALPLNLFAKVPSDIAREHLREAAFTTIGSIALQGIRRLAPQMGEWVVVFGLGLIGQIAVRLLKLSGVKVIGVDIDSSKFKFAEGWADYVLGSDENLVQKVRNITKYGADAVLIAANDRSGKVIEMAGEMARDRARVVAVGQSKMDIPWKPYYFRELELRISRAYGAGRYDPRYEVEGIDYPIGYVRWTIKRNMEAFIDALPRLNLSDLITHEFPFEKAEEVYKFLMERKEPYLGVVFRYDSQPDRKRTVFVSPSVKLSRVNVAFIGAGSYAKNFLIPAFLSRKEVSGLYVITSRPENAVNVARRFGIRNASTSIEDALNDPDVNLVVIATPHNTHFRFVKAAIEKGKAVYVEKPPVMNREELEELAHLYRENPVPFATGFNRRFAPFSRALKEFIRQNPPFFDLLYRVNAGKLKDHWLTDPQVGGGRYIGEGVHFVDYALFLAEKEPQSVSARFYDNENWTVVYRFENALATINYFNSGSPKEPKEYIEVSAGGRTMKIVDFRELWLDGKRFRKAKQDKGVEHLIGAFVDYLTGKGNPPISFDEIYRTMDWLFKAIENE